MTRPLLAAVPTAVPYLDLLGPRFLAVSLKGMRIRRNPAWKKMADVLDVDVEDKGGFSEDEGDGKNDNTSN